MKILTTAAHEVSKQAFQKGASCGRLLSLSQGVYVDADEYSSLDISEQYRVRAQAFLAIHPKLTAWGITAAALEGAPILQGAPLQFSGEKSAARSRQRGCLFHKPLPDVPQIANRTAQLLFECAISSPLPDTLLAANYFLRSYAKESPGDLSATRVIDEKTVEALIRLPLSETRTKAALKDKVKVRKNKGQPLLSSDRFLVDYLELRKTDIAATNAELLLYDYVQLCGEYRAVRGVRQALKAGLYFSDQMESPAEALLIARCVELGFSIPYLQVSILHPEDGRFLGRVDGLWPSRNIRKELCYSDTKFGRVLSSKTRGDNESIIIEFDGRLKYDASYSETLEKERQRQNAIGNLGFRFVRVSWSDLMQPKRLRDILESANVPKQRPDF
jgi:hypothetical protein